MTTRHAPVSLLPLVALASALALSPAAATAQSGARRTTNPSSADSSLVGRLELDGALGLAVPFESGLNAGFKLRGGVLMGMQTLTPGVILQVGGQVGWTYEGYSSPLSGSINSIDLLPLARVRIGLAPQLFGYGDAGLGLGIVHSSVTTPAPFPGFPSVKASKTDAALLIKLGGGLGYDLRSDISLVLEPAFHIYVKDGSITQFTLLAGVLYRP